MKLVLCLLHGNCTIQCSLELADVLHVEFKVNRYFYPVSIDTMNSSTEVYVRCEQILQPVLYYFQARLGVASVLVSIDIHLTISRS